MVRYLRRFKMFAGARTLWNPRDASLSPPLEPELTLWVANQPSMWLSYTKGMITFPLCLGTFTFWLLGSCKKDNSEMAMRPQTAWNDPAQASTIWGCHNGSPTSSTRSAKVRKPYKKKKTASTTCQPPCQETLWDDPAHPSWHSEPGLVVIQWRPCFYISKF